MTTIQRLGLPTPPLAQDSAASSKVPHFVVKPTSLPSPPIQDGSFSKEMAFKLNGLPTPPLQDATQLPAFWQPAEANKRKFTDPQPANKRKLHESGSAHESVFDGITDSITPAQVAAVCPSTPTPIAPSEVFSRKEDFVESLVDTAVRLLEIQWKSNSSTPSKSRLVPLKTFMKEILKRSRTSFSTLQLCLLYLVRFRHHLPAYNRTLALEAAAAAAAAGDSTSVAAVAASSASICPQQKKAHPSCCSRRMFLSALIVAAKYVQDRNYSNKAWSKIAGLPVEEITLNEREFLKCLNWKLHVTKRSFVSWSSMLLNVAHQIRSHGENTGMTSGLVVEGGESLDPVPSASDLVDVC